jgi:hypothetical protein
VGPGGAAHDALALDEADLLVRALAGGLARSKPAPIGEEAESVAELVPGQAHVRQQPRHPDRTFIRAGVGQMPDEAGMTGRRAA